MPDYRWKSLVLPLADGASEETSDLDGRNPGIQFAQNVDFGRKGEVRGRLGEQLHDVFGQRTLDTISVVEGAADPGTNTLSTRTGSAPLGLFRYRDSLGERPGLLTHGRTYTWEGDRWTDRLYGVAARADRLLELGRFTQESQSAQYAVGDNFAMITSAGGTLSQGNTVPAFGAIPAIEYYLPGRNLLGTAANVVIGPDTYHCIVGNDGSTNKLYVEVRRNQDATITEYNPANDCLVAPSPNTVVCSSFGSFLYVMYIVTGGSTTYKLLKIDPTTGSVSASTSVTPTITGTLLGVWLSAETGTLFTSYVTTGIAAGDVGVHMEAHTTTLAATGTPARLDNLSVALSTGSVVIGGVDSTHAWVAYTKYESGITGGTVSGLVIGKYDSGLGRGDIYKSYHDAGPAGVANATGFNSFLVSWGITHQPIQINSRTILGIWGGIQDVSAQQATWFEIDVTDLVLEAGSANAPGATRNPILVAMGTPTGTQRLNSAASAIKLPDGVTWTFPTVNYSAFSALGGYNPTLGINKVSLMSPQVTQIGEETLIGGSVPHMIARGWTSEVGYVMVAPGLAATQGALAGGSLTGGGTTYTFQATWRWIDESGQIHRSAPSLPYTVGVAGAVNKNIDIKIATSQLTEREFGTIYCELWMTQPNPTGQATKYLAATLVPTPNTAYVATNIQVEVSTNNDTLYTTGGVFANNVLSADGGCASVGKRCWISDGQKAYASKIYRGGPNAPAWNDDGVLEVSVPATAGRVVALEALDEKLVILCERGIYLTQGEGPDDLGAGPDFLFPMKVSDIGCAGPRSSVSTPHGVFFYATNTDPTADGAVGGVFLLDRGFSMSNVSLPVVDDLVPGPAQMTYNPERDLLYVAGGITDVASYMVVLDLRAKEWCRWVLSQQQRPVTTMTCSGGVLWTMGSQNEGPAAFTATDGIDHTSLGSEPITMLVRTQHMYANGEDGLGWGAVRSLRVLGKPATHTLEVDVTYDQLTTVQKFYNLVAGADTGTWPSQRYAPEWLLPRQKASSIQVQLKASPATGTWVALRLDILPNKYAPTLTRN
jgi:hypothetical protein